MPWDNYFMTALFLFSCVSAADKTRNEVWLMRTLVVWVCIQQKNPHDGCFHFSSGGHLVRKRLELVGQKQTTWVLKLLHWTSMTSLLLERQEKGWSSIFKEQQNIWSRVLGGSKTSSTTRLCLCEMWSERAAKSDESQHFVQNSNHHLWCEELKKSKVMKRNATDIKWKTPVSWVIIKTFWSGIQLQWI